MFKKILGTGAVRAINLLTQFATLVMGTKFLGAAEWGIAYTVQVDNTFLLIGIELLAGSGLVYFTPRKKLSTLLTLSFAWIAIVMLFYVLLFKGLSLFPDFYHRIVPEGYATILLLQTLTYSLHEFNLNYFLGKEKVKTFNLLFLLQILTQVGTMSLFIFAFEMKDARAFLYSQLCGYTLALIVGWILLLPTLKREGLDPIKPTLKEMFGYGVVMQLSNIVATINKRLNLYVLQGNSSPASAGVYGTGTQVTESVKIIGNSIGLVQFSALSNTESQERANQLTLRFMKISVALTLFAMIVVSLLPTSLFEWLFSKEFSEIRTVIILMAPGIVFFSAHNILANHFQGTGQPKYNLYASLIGLAITLPSVYILIPWLGIAGAAISTSLTFAAIFIYQWIVFHRLTNIKLSQLVPNRDDCEWLKEEISGIFNKG